MANRHAIITGGSSGIGRAIAQQLNQQNFHLSLIARTQSKLDAAADSLRRIQQPHKTQKIVTLAADVAIREQAEQAIQSAIAQNGPPDILITSAGMARPGYFRSLPIDIFEETMAVNYFGALYCIKAALPAMCQANTGQLVLISSGTGLIGLFGYTPYSPSKFALRGLAESLRGELKLEGISVSIVYPPDTDTPQLAAENEFKPLETQQMTAMAQCLSAEQVANAILKGLRKQQFVITPGLEMKLLARFHSLAAPILNWQFDRIVKAVRKQAGK